jgi:hypothetical protein
VSAEENNGIVRRYFEEFLSSREHAILEEMMGSDLPRRRRWRRLGLSTSTTAIPAGFRWRARPAP